MRKINSLREPRFQVIGDHDILYINHLYIRSVIIILFLYYLLVKLYHTFPHIKMYKMYNSASNSWTKNRLHYHVFDNGITFWSRDDISYRRIFDSPRTPSFTNPRKSTRCADTELSQVAQMDTARHSRRTTGFLRHHLRSASYLGKLGTAEFQAPTSMMRNLRKFILPARFRPLRPYGVARSSTVRNSRTFFALANERLNFRMRNVAFRKGKIFEKEYRSIKS